MNQVVFNALAFTCAWAERNRNTLGGAVDDATAQMFKSYAASYSEDNFREEIFQAVEILDKWLDSQTWLTETDRDFWYSALRQVCTKWMPNGVRRKWKIFNGVRFTSPQVKPNDRVQQFTKDLALYFVNINTGEIKLK